MRVGGAGAWVRVGGAGAWVRVGGVGAWVREGGAGAWAWGEVWARGDEMEAREHGNVGMRRAQVCGMSLPLLLMLTSGKVVREKQEGGSEREVRGHGCGRVLGPGTLV